MSSSFIILCPQGKTYSLSSLEPDHMGVIPRTMSLLFEKIAQDAEYEWLVEISYLQIYLEAVRTPQNSIPLIAFLAARGHTPNRALYCLVRCWARSGAMMLVHSRPKRRFFGLLPSPFLSQSWTTCWHHLR